MTIELEVGDTVIEFPDGTPKERMLAKAREAVGAISAPTATSIAAIAPPEMPWQPQTTRSGMQMIGATAGGILGAPAGPAGALGGMMLGSAAGELTFQSLNDFLAATRGREPMPGALPAEQRIGAAAEAGAMEGAFSAGSSALLFPIKHFLSPVLGTIFGVRGEGPRAMQELAKRQGVELGAVDIGGPAAKGFAKVLGVFPFTGTPLRKAMVAKEAQSLARAHGILDEMAPTSTLAGEVGVDLMKAAQASDVRFRRASAELYNKFREFAEKSDATIPMNETQKKVAEFVGEFKLGEIPLQGADRQVLKGGLNEEFETFLTDLQNLPGGLTMPQYQLLKKRLSGFVNEMKPDPFTVKRVAQIKQAMEADLNDIKVSEGGLDAADKLAELRSLKKDADKFFSNGIVIFQTPTAAKFGRVDKNVFRAGPDKTGTINPDELLKPVFNADSADALRDLRSLVGDDAFRRAARAHMEDSLAKSFRAETRAGEEVRIFDPDLFAKNLGLVAGFKNRTLALEEMLTGTNVTVRDIKDFAEAVRVAKISDPSSFVSRRVTLGGIGALTAVAGGIGGPVAAAGSPVSAVAVGLLARHGSKILAEPKYLEALQRSFSPTLDEVQRRALVVRLGRELGDSMEE